MFNPHPYMEPICQYGRAGFDWSDFDYSLDATEWLPRGSTTPDCGFRRKDGSNFLERARWARVAEIKAMMAGAVAAAKVSGG